MAGPRPAKGYPAGAATDENRAESSGASEIRRTPNNAGDRQKRASMADASNRVYCNCKMTNETAASEYSTIPVRPETRDELRKMKAYRGMTWEQLLRAEILDDD